MRRSYFLILTFSNSHEEPAGRSSLHSGCPGILNVAFEVFYLMIVDFQNHV